MYRSTLHTELRNKYRRNMLEAIREAIAEGLWMGLVVTASLFVAVYFGGHYYLYATGHYERVAAAHTAPVACKAR